MKIYTLSLFLLCFFSNYLYAQLDYSLTVDGGNVINETGELLADCAANIEYPIKGVVVNHGTESITSFDLIVDNILTYSYSADIGQNEVFRYEIPDKLNTGNTWSVHTVVLENVNGNEQPDSNALDNSALITFDPIPVEMDKAILLEEVTGTWCSACPKGTVYLDEMAKRFGKHLVGVAVHNDDPMEKADHIDALFSNHGDLFGYPQMVLDRKEVHNPFDIPEPVVARLAVPAIAKIELGGKVVDKNLKTSARVTFKENIVGGNFSVAVIVTEDLIINDDDSNYDQANAYAGSAALNGVTMGGFGYFDHQVKSSIWPYSHVSRLLIGDYNGLNKLVGNFEKDEIANVVFDYYPNDPEWNLEQVKLVAILLDANTGEVLNTSAVKYAEMLDNGVFTNTQNISTETVFHISPNPSHENVTISMSLEKSEIVEVDIITVQGQLLSSSQLHGNQGGNVFSFDISDLNSGIYWIQISAGSKRQTLKLCVQE